MEQPAVDDGVECLAERDEALLPSRAPSGMPICTTSDADKLELSSVRYVVDQLLYLARYWLLMTATTPYVVFVPQVVEPKRPLHIS